MERIDLRHILEEVQAGTVSPQEAESVIATAPMVNLGYATVDTQRGVRQGASEVIYGAGKTAAQIAGIADALVASGAPRVMATRVDEEKASKTIGLLTCGLAATWDPVSRVLLVGEKPQATGVGEIIVACAGTSDLPVAEEAALTCEILGNRVRRLTDVGVAGLHRLLSHAQELASARAIIAVAGMEGALPSVIAGMVSCPVIAVPTSVGYGASLGGITALLAMLTSCASGVSVVNIDNGFGAGYQASLINHLPCA